MKINEPAKRLRGRLPKIRIHPEIDGRRPPQGGMVAGPRRRVGSALMSPSHACFGRGDPTHDRLDVGVAAQAERERRTQYLLRLFVPLTHEEGNYDTRGT